MNEQNTTLSINGKNYEINNLPQEIQYLLLVFQNWETELKASKVEVFKLEAAIKAISSEIESRINRLESNKT